MIVLRITSSILLTLKVRIDTEFSYPQPSGLSESFVLSDSWYRTVLNPYLTGGDLSRSVVNKFSSFQALLFFRIFSW